MRDLIVDKYVLKAPVITILRRLQLVLDNGKLKEVRDGLENIVVTCPNHGDGLESHPACNIYVGENTELSYGYFNCFVCNAKGSFLKFVADCFETSEKSALKWLLKTFEHERFGDNLNLGPDIDLSKNKKKVKVLDEALLDNYLSWTPYLAQRKLSREVCEAFKIRYDPIYRQVIFPAYDLKGRLVMLPKRSIDTKTFYLDKELEKPVYCLDYIQKHNYTTAIITEGPYDTLTGWTYGYPTCGTFGQPSDYQIEQLNKSCISVLYLAFDNDEAGRRFTRAVKRGLDKRIMTVDVTLPKNKKDLNDLTKEEFEAAIQEAAKHF